MSAPLLQRQWPVSTQTGGDPAADVVGYFRLMGRDESGTMAALKALRQEVIDPAIARHGGSIVKTTGDGLFAGVRPCGAR
jgi:hypothetical protein